jgi:hypothetical protein
LKKKTKLKKILNQIELGYQVIKLQRLLNSGLGHLTGLGFSSVNQQTLKLNKIHNRIGLEVGLGY